MTLQWPGIHACEFAMYTKPYGGGRVIAALPYMRARVRTRHDDTHAREFRSPAIAAAAATAASACVIEYRGADHARIDA